MRYRKEKMRKLKSGTAKERRRELYKSRMSDSTL